MTTKLLFKYASQNNQKIPKSLPRIYENMRVKGSKARVVWEILTREQEASLCTGGRRLGPQETKEEARRSGRRRPPGPGDAQHGRGEGDPAGGERGGRADTL